jgi:hypothetical protein
VESFFKKNRDFADDSKCEEAAQQAFAKGEKLCRIANRRLDYYYVKRDRIDPDLNLIISKMGEVIHRTLGSFGPFLEELPQRIRVTDGATQSRSRKLSRPWMKIRGKIEAAPGARPYLEAIAKYFGYKFLKVVPQMCNRIELVPKSWKTHRTIACEPEGNIPLQLAFDSYVKDRLLRFLGIDLRDQGKNQALARKGSINGTIATIDLSMASDTVCVNAVWWLFPLAWCRYLFAIRSANFSGSTGEGMYAKFSSMGNGTTFTVETLIFAAACKAVGSKEFSVYGDDIIIESELVPQLIRVLRFFGFVINQEKSFTTGPYRESCGEHWFLGENVTAFYIRTWGRNKATLCHNVNNLARIAYPGGNLWKLLREIVRDSSLPYVPFNNISTSGIWIDVSDAYQKKLIRHRKGRLSYKVYASRNTLREVPYSGSYFLWHLDAWKAEIHKRRDPFKKRIVRARDTDTSLTGYVRKRVGWFPPAEAPPVHLYWWSDYLIRES